MSIIYSIINFLIKPEDSNDNQREHKIVNFINNHSAEIILILAVIIIIIPLAIVNHLCSGKDYLYILQTIIISFGFILMVTGIYLSIVPTLGSDILDIKKLFKENRIGSFILISSLISIIFLIILIRAGQDATHEKNFEIINGKLELTASIDDLNKDEKNYNAYVILLETNDSYLISPCDLSRKDKLLIDTDYQTLINKNGVTKQKKEFKNGWEKYTCKKATKP